MANDVELVVGARNEAKAVLAELGQQLSDLAVPAEQSSMKAQAAIAGLISRVAQSAAALTGVIGAVAAGAAGLLTASAVKSMHDEAEALDALNRQLDNYVGKSRISSDVHREFAEEVKRSLNVSEAETLSLMEKASALGVAEGKLDDAALAAIGLSRALGIDLNSALTKVLNGDDDLVSMLDSVNSGLKEQGGEIGELTGLWNFLQSQAKQTIEAILQATQPLRESLAAVAVVIKDSLITAIVGAVTAIEVFRDNSTAAFLYIGTAAELLFLQMVEDTKHTFTVAMPAYTVWFIDNLFNLMKDGFNAILAMHRNFNQAIGQAVVLTWEFIASGGEGGIEKLKQNLLDVASTLLDGFEQAASPIPEIIERKITDEEAALARQMGELGKTLGESFTDKFRENMAGIKDFLKPVVPQVDANGLDFGAAAGKGKKAQDLNAVESRLLKFGPAEKGIDKIAKNTEKAATLLDMIKTAVQKDPTGKSLKLEFVD